MKALRHALILGLLAAGSGIAFAQSETPIDPNPPGGPFSPPVKGSDNPYDAPVPGFVGPDGAGAARLSYDSGLILNTNNYVNPIFFGWASSVVNYSPFDYDSMYDYEPDFVNPLNVLGPVTGDVFDIASLGDMSQAQINAWIADPIANDGPGTLTVSFTKPIVNLSGADFVVFENGFVSNYTTAAGTIKGQFWGEFAYVEVSADGVNFVRFPSVSLTPKAVGRYGTIDSSNVFNLVGKHANAYGLSWGTPFDLSDVGLSQIKYIRLVDIPGSGNFLDNAVACINPATGLPYTSNHPIYDGWLTWGSGGADIEALGAISSLMTFSEWPQLAKLDASKRGANDDPDHDGRTNLEEYAFAMLPWICETGVAPVRTELVKNTEGETALELIFRRDERLTDVTYEVQASDDLRTWQTIARSSGGAPATGVNGFTPVITETSASTVASVGVVRNVRVRDVVNVDSGTARRFFRIQVSLQP